MGLERGPAGKAGRVFVRGNESNAFGMTGELVAEPGWFWIDISCGTSGTGGINFSSLGIGGRNAVGTGGMFVEPAGRPTAAAIAFDTARADLCERFLRTLGALSWDDILEDAKPPADGVVNVCNRREEENCGKLSCETAPMGFFQCSGVGGTE